MHGGLFVREIEKGDTRQRGDQEDHVEPTVVEVELQVAEHFRDDRSAR